MKKYLINEGGNFYKANLHCHSTFSDGVKTPEQLKELYMSMDYSIIAFTEHDVLIPQDQVTDENFLALHGFEVEILKGGARTPYEIKTCHICFIGLEPENITQPFWHRTLYVGNNAKNYKHLVKFDENEPDYVRVYSGEAITKMMKEAREKGFFVTYNHPTWSLETYPDYIGYNGMHAMEIYNGGALTDGFLDYNPRVYDDMLMDGKRIYCIGADDNHNWADPPSRKCDAGKAWTMIKADKLEYRTITKAIEEGQYYASEGPEIYELYVEDGKVHVKCSAADRIHCTYGARHAEIAANEDRSPVTEAAFNMNPDWKYFRITVVDNSGKTACTNAYFFDELQ